jgi:autotransporter-associated beta strand protein
MRAGRNGRRGSGRQARGTVRVRSGKAAIGLEQLEARRVLSAATGQEESALDPKTYAADRVLVKFRQPVSPPFMLSAGTAGTGSSGSLKSVFPTTLTSILDSFGASDARRVFPTAPRTSGLTIQSASLSNAADAGDEVPDAQSVGLDRWYSFDLAPGSDVAEVLAALAADGAVEAAEPDYLFKLSSLLDGPGGASTSGDEAGIASLPSADTDPAYGQQWHLDAVNAPAAWAHLESLGLPAGGRSDIVIAVIDTGVDYTHPDLAANMWVNTAEIPGNGIDDDGNGFVDDVHGAAVVSDSRSHSGNPMDDNGHGTHVAGIAAASADNDLGGVGIAYNARIMGIKAFGYAGTGSSTDIAEAIYYAVENGADIINMSFGSYAESSLVKDALQVAFGTSVLVAAAGNDGRGNLSCPPTDVPPPANMYPAAYNWVLGVMASSPTPHILTGWRAPFSNKDCVENDAHEYEILAPGASIYSTLPGGTYSAWSGTSMAAPVVSGIAALLRTKFADTDLYSSRFIMGQLAVGRGEDPLGYVIDAERNLTDTPQPNLSYRDHLLFDTTAQDAGNDADGRVDAGETVDLAITIRNHWGRADNVTVVLDAFAVGAAGPDPYVTMITDTVNYGAVGTFNEDDNGLIYEDGVITGVTSPFRFSVAATTPNEHVIPFRLTITATNGLDPGDQTVYTFESRFKLAVQRGRELPSVITEDMVLDDSTLWIVGRPVLVPKGITLTVGPGAQVQWGTTQPADPYAVAQIPLIQVEGTFTVSGTATRPARLFASDALTETWQNVRQQPSVRIFRNGASSAALTTINHAVIENPYFYGRLTSITNSVITGDGTNRAAVEPATDWSSWVYRGRGLQISVDDITDSRLSLKALFGNPWASGSGLRTSFRGVLLEGLTAVNNQPIKLSPYRAFSENVVLGQNWLPNSYVIFNDDLFLGLGRMPGVGTLEVAQAQTDRRNNAILNPLWNASPTTWLRFENFYPFHVGMGGNYWGTENLANVAALLVDQADNFNKGQIVVDPVLSTPSETTYPFVVGVDVANGEGASVSWLDRGPATFTVTFNRDMDTSAQPQVGFGPAFPYTDHTVNGDWVDARTWQGTYNVTPLTGDGYQLIRVAGARAADKPWLVTGNDAGRFRFEIVTSGTQSMNLQASGGEGKVDLSWTQDDFDLLAGYNIYRATSADGTYIRVNSSIIPKEQTAFTDTTVQPAQTYFYKFRIVKTDSTESVDSNVAAAAPLDTIPPVISHTALPSAVPNFAVTIRADITDNLAVQGVTLHYRAIGETTYQTRAMTLTTGDRYTASLDAGTMTAPGVEYYISATDGVTTVYHGLAAQPHRISVVDRPVVTTITPAIGPSTGGTSVTIVGSNFKAGASVTMGGAVASNVTVVSDTQITATTPAGVPAYADVRVINTDEAAGTLLGGFRYVAEGVLVSVPTLTAESGGTVEVPISVADVTGLLSATVTLTFDPTVLQPTGARTGPLTAGWAVDANTATSGQVSLALAGATSVSATGVLAIVSFDVVGDPDSSTALTVSSVSLNDGAIAAQAAAGQLAVNDLHAISGLVRYYADNTPVAGVAVFLEGEASLDVATDSLGAYSFAGLRGGDYTLMPDKQADVRQITAYDAALVLQAVTGRRSLSANETTAADVNRRDGVTALDAAYILQKSVGLIPGTFPNAGTSWVFTPAQRTYTGLAADQLNQHFTGILLGDVSGNWATEVGGAGLPDDVGIQAEPHQLTIGSALVLPGEPGVRVPVRIERGNPDVYAADLTITYDVGTLSLAAGGIAVGEAATGMALAVNTATPGVIRIGLAGAEPIAADGDLVVLEFDVTGDAASAGTVAFGAASLNEGAANVTTANGTLALDPGTVVADGQETIDSTVRTGGERIVKRGGGRLVLDRANSHTGGTIVEAGEVVVRNAAALGQGRLDVRPGATVVLEVGYEAVTLGSLALDATGRIDVGTGRISVPAGGYDPATLRQLLTSGRNGGSWDGTTGITSRAAGANSKRAIGYVESGGMLTLGWAAYGDLNLDGRVNSTDLSLLTGGGRYNQSGSDGVWAQGDLNYDGRVNSTDISLLTSAALYNRPSYRTGSGTAPLGGSSTSLMNVATWQALGAEEPGEEEADRVGE